jgi:hypothetical protein
MWNSTHAAPWSDLYGKQIRDRRSHQKWTKQRVQEEEILDGKGPWTLAGEYCRPKEEIEAAKAEWQQLNGTSTRGNPKNILGEGTWSQSGSRVRSKIPE